MVSIRVAFNSSNFIYSSFLFLKLNIERILAILKEITEELKCYNFLDVVRKKTGHIWENSVLL